MVRYLSSCDQTNINFIARLGYSIICFYSVSENYIYTIADGQNVIELVTDSNSSVTREKMVFTNYCQFCVYCFRYQNYWFSRLLKGIKTDDGKSKWQN